MDEQIEQISDNRRKREIIDGRIYLMASASNEHIDVRFNVADIFNSYFKNNKKRCRARNDSDFVIDKDNIFRPDVKVLCHDNGSIPVIVVEVLSNSTRDRDLGIKMRKYAEIGVKEYWIITWETCTIDIYLLTENHKYEHYKSYVLKSDSDDEETEVVTEFFPVSFPELKVQLADVFNIYMD